MTFQLNNVMIDSGTNINQQNTIYLKGYITMITFTLIVLLSLYFLPTLIASFSRHRDLASIFMLNLFLGWTFICWIVALVWSVVHENNSRLYP